MPSELVRMDKPACVSLTLAYRFKVNRCNRHLKWIHCADEGGSTPSETFSDDVMKRPG